MTLEQLHAIGFDASYPSEDSPGYNRIRCSQCQAMTVNGYPIHERGCPNEPAECEECGSIIPRSDRLCESCWHAEYGMGDDSDDFED